MINLIAKLKVIAAKSDESDARTVEAAIMQIQQLEEKLREYEDDITDWQFAVEKQMKRKDERK